MGPTGFEQMHRQRSLRTDHWLHFTQIIPVFKHRFRRYVLSALYTVYVVQAGVNTRLLAASPSNLLNELKNGICSSIQVFLVQAHETRIET